MYAVPLRVCFVLLTRAFCFLACNMINKFRYRKPQPVQVGKETKDKAPVTEKSVVCKDKREEVIKSEGKAF